MIIINQHTAITVYLLMHKNQTDQALKRKQKNTKYEICTVQRITGPDYSHICIGAYIRVSEHMLRTFIQML